MRLEELEPPSAPARQARRASSRGGAAKIWRAIREDIGALHFKLLMAGLLLAPVPSEVGGRLRARVLRLAGFDIGKGTVIAGTPRITGGPDLYKRLVVGKRCYFNAQVVLEAHGDIIIGDGVGLGQQTMVLTSTHEMGPGHHRVGPRTPLPVHIRDGAWIGARCTILPGVTIGEGAVVAAGAVVTRDIPPNTMVAGVPAKPVREFD